MGGEKPNKEILLILLGVFLASCAMGRRRFSSRALCMNERAGDFFFWTFLCSSSTRTGDQRCSASEYSILIFCA